LYDSAGVIDGPGVKVLHGGLFKRFKAERFNIRIGMEATNILNHPNWGNLSFGSQTNLQLVAHAHHQVAEPGERLGR